MKKTREKAHESLRKRAEMKKIKEKAHKSQRERGQK